MNVRKFIVGFRPGVLNLGSVDRSVSRRIMVLLLYRSSDHLVPRNPFPAIQMRILIINPHTRFCHQQWWHVVWFYGLPIIFKRTPPVAFRPRFGQRLLELRNRFWVRPKQFVGFQGFLGGLFPLPLTLLDLRHLEMPSDIVRRYFQKLSGAFTCQVITAR